MTKIFYEVEEGLKKDLEQLKAQNKKLKVEVEQTRVLNAKYKDDIERQRLEFLKEIT